MNTNNGAIAFDAYLSTDQFKSGIAGLENQIKGFTNNTNRSLDNIGDSFNKLARLAAGAFAFTELSQLPGKISQVRGEFQQLEISFATMLQSKAKADKLMSQLVTFAGTTPFGLQDSAGAAKQLLAYGVQAENVTKTLRKLGDVSAGIGAPLADLTYLYGTTLTQGRLYTQDLNQFTGRGIPLIKELAAQFKVNESAVKGLVEAGKVGFPEVEKAIDSLTGKGSIFGGLMEQQSKSILGLQSQFTDALDVMFNDLGKQNEGAISTAIQGGISIVENYESILDILKVMVATYGAYKAALIATSALQATQAVAGNVQAWFQLATGIKSAKDAQIAFNLATSVNPYAAVIALVATLGAAYAVYGGKLTEAEKAQDRLNASMEKSDQELNKEISNIEVLKKQIQNETFTRDKRNAKVKELINLNPEILSSISLENIATGQSTNSINEYIRAKKEQIRVSKIQAQIDDNLNRISDISSGRADSDFGVSTLAKSGLMQAQAASGGTFNAEQLIKKDVEAQKKAAIDALKDFNKGLLDQVNNGIEQRRASRRQDNANQQESLLKTVGYYDEEIKALKSKQAAEATTKQKYLEFQKQIDALEAKRNGITGGSSKPKTETVKAAETEKDVRIKTFQEEIEEKKNLYALYERWVQNYGKEAANEQFKTLISQNKSFVDYLDNQINGLEQRKKVGFDGSFSLQDSIDLDSLITQKGQSTGGKSAIELFKDQLDAARESSITLTDELEKLRDIQNNLDPNDNTSIGAEKRLMVKQQEIEAQKERKKVLSAFLVDVAGSEAARTKIENYYADLRAEADARYNDKKSEAYLNTIKQIASAQKQELGGFDSDKITNSQGYKELDRIIKVSSNNQTKIKLDALKEQLKNLKDANLQETEEHKNKLIEVDQAESEHKQKSIQTYLEIAGVVNELGQTLEGMGGSIGEIGGALSGLSSQAGNIGSILSVDEGDKLSMNQYAAAIQAVINMIGALVSASKKRAEAEKQFALARIAYENDYQLAANSKIGDSYNQNPFYQDFDGQIKAATAQYQDAFDKYQASIKKIEEQGKAKEKQKDSVDGKTVGQMVGSGAVAGAVIGTAIGGWAAGIGTVVGTAVGAVVGLVGGLFAKKKKDVYDEINNQYPQLIKATADGWKELDVAMAKSLISSNQVDDATKQLLQNAIDLADAMEETKDTVIATVKELTGEIGDNLRNSLVGAFKEGESAAEAFGTTVDSIIGSIVEKLLFSKLVGPAIDQLTSEFSDSLSAGGDGTIVDDLVKFKEYGMPAIQNYFDGLGEFDKWAKENGIDNAFGTSSDSETKTPVALQGTISGASEESISILNGQINAIRITQADGLNVSRSALFQLTAINLNTGLSAQELTIIRADMAEIKKLLGTDFLRAIGG